MTPCKQLVWNATHSSVPTVTAIVSINKGKNNLEIPNWNIGIRVSNKSQERTCNVVNECLDIVVTIYWLFWDLSDATLGYEDRD